MNDQFSGGFCGGVKSILECAIGRIKTKAILLIFKFEHV